MTRPRTVSSEAMLQTARTCVIERGPAVSLEVIAERLGVSAPALLKRFGNRQEFIIQALRSAEPPPWVVDLEAGPDDRPLAQQLAQFVTRTFQYFEREMPCMTALSESGFPVELIFGKAETPPPFRHIWALASWLQRAQARGLVAKDAIAGGDFESVAAGLLGAMHGRVFLSDYVGTAHWRRSHDEFTRDLARTYARALGPRSKPSTAKPSTAKSRHTKNKKKPAATRPLRARTAQRKKS